MEKMKDLAAARDEGLRLWYLIAWPDDGRKPVHLAGPEDRDILEHVAQGWIDHCRGFATVSLVSTEPQLSFPPKAATS